jgi:two-component system response regulator YesN
MKVLLADNSYLILERLQEMLVKFPEVEIAGQFSNGLDALNALKTLHPDLAIVDNRMPGLSGLKVLEEIRKENKGVRFVILTFYSSVFYRQLAMQLGADHFFSKIDEFEKVSEVVAEMLASKHYEK